MKNKLVWGLLASVVLAGCGGGGGGSSGSGSGSQTTSSSSSTGTPETVTDAQIITDIQTSQASANATPIWDTSQPYNSVGV
ncbi:hypothetical protein [Paraburkholderia ferrariae]|uniref:hypothetical protein n=1 Tax=Paraburkholderia ferrariae TaxID=386056 RepID=UPI0012EBF0DE|nr:hypothetical protein [Paraburkholderia ferrariae]